MNWRYKQERLLVFCPECMLRPHRGSQTRRRREDEEKETKAEKKWESDLRGGREKRISYLILSPGGKGGWKVRVEECVWHGRRSTSLGGDHQFSLFPATTGQDEVPRQGKVLTTMMVLVVFSCVVLHNDWVVCVCVCMCICVHVCYLFLQSEAQDTEGSTNSLCSLMEGKAKQNNESLGDLFFLACVWVSVYFGFCISFNSSSPKRINLVFFHHIHYWHIRGREPAVVPEQLALGQSGGACLIRKTIRM